MWERNLGRNLSAVDLLASGTSVRRDAGSKTVAGWLEGGHIGLNELAGFLDDGLDPNSALAQEMAEDALYAPYIQRQDAELRDLRANEAIAIPADFDYSRIPGLSNEMNERLTTARPATLSAASRVPGITPAALAALLVHVKRHVTICA